MKKIEELVADPSFNNWVKNNNKKDKKFWDAWILQHPEQKETIELATALILGIKFNKAEGLSNQEIKSRFAKLNQKLEEEQKSKTVPFFSWSTLSRVAAVFIGVAVLGFVLWNYSLSGHEKTHTTDFGEITNITLPDGSEVTLNSNSKLTISKGWQSGKTREVWLQGEAFFKVDKLLKTHETHDNIENTSFVKFIVHTPQVNVEVIGTQFNVHNRRGATQVALSSGRIELSKTIPSDTTKMIMIPGELVKISSKSKTFNKRKINTETYTSWTQHKLVFNNTSLNDIALILEDNYGLEVNIKDNSLKGRKLTGEISVKNADDLINALSKSLNIHITRKNNKLVIDNN